MKLKVIVAHPGKQHSYQTAIAVDRMGADLIYCTTVYDKPGSITHIIKKFLKGMDRAKADTRSCAQISNKKVFQRLELYGLYQLLMARICKSSKKNSEINDAINDRFGRAISTLAKRKNVDVIVSYDNNSLTLFKTVKKIRPQVIRILDTSAANRLYMKKIYEKDFEVSPEFAEKLKNECAFVQSDHSLERIKEEIQCAQYFLVGSTFVKRSLEYSGVDSEHIYVCPYGVDTHAFHRENLKVREEDKPIRFVFVGGTKQIKGLSYMLEAFQKIDHKKATFTIIGKDDLNSDLKQKYARDVIFTGIVPHDEIPMLLQNFDVMVFPSLGEGFSLSMVEALACGLPIISSCNTGVNDYISEGINGFITPIQNSIAVAEKMQWFIEHREKIPEMGLNAISTAEKLTWENYYKQIGDAIREIVEKEKRVTMR